MKLLMVADGAVEQLVPQRDSIIAAAWGKMVAAAELWDNLQ